MSDNEVSTNYAGIILQMWVDIIRVREEFRANHILGSPDIELQNQYIAKLTSLWLELQPKVEGRTELGDLKNEFESFEKYYFDPEQLSPKDTENKAKADDIYKLEYMLRKVIEKLKITAIE